MLDGLPTARRDPAFRRVARRFFADPDHPDPLHHRMQVHALDGAVCQILGAIRKTPVVLGNPLVASGLCAIHRDEARHVGITRRWAARLGDPAALDAWCQRTRTGLVDLLAWRSDELLAVGIDIETLFAQLAWQRAD